MKVTIDVDCTPDEARRFLGLPDVQPMQQAVMQEMQDRLLASLQSMEPDALWKTWMPAAATGFDQMQKFWSQVRAAADTKNPRNDCRGPYCIREGGPRRGGLRGDELAPGHTETAGLLEDEPAGSRPVAGGKASGTRPVRTAAARSLAARRTPRPVPIAVPAHRYRGGRRARARTGRPLVRRSAQRHAARLSCALRGRGGGAPPSLAARRAFFCSA